MALTWLQAGGGARAWSWAVGLILVRGEVKVDIVARVALSVAAHVIVDIPWVIVYMTGTSLRETLKNALHCDWMDVFPTRQALCVV